MAHKTKAMIAIEERLAQLAPGSFRFQVLSAALDFKHAWVALGELLTQVRDQKVYKEWGYEDFEHYCERELLIRKSTAHKLTATYGFMQRREPSLLAEVREHPERRVQLPDYDVIRLLSEAEARGQIGDREYESVRGEVFVGKPPPAAKVARMIEERWPRPKPKVPEKTRLARLARAANKVAEAAATLESVPRETVERARALAEELAALATERAA
jgi:hypothetical protein